MTVVSEPHHEEHVPQLVSPLTPEQLDALKHHIDPLQPSESNGVDIFMYMVQYFEGLLQDY